MPARKRGSAPSILTTHPVNGHPRAPRRPRAAAGAPRIPAPADRGAVNTRLRLAEHPAQRPTGLAAGHPAGNALMHGAATHRLHIPETSGELVQQAAELIHGHGVTVRNGCDLGSRTG
jgi:hypothetical protein